MVVDVRHPVTHGFVDGVLERLGAVVTGMTVAPSNCMRATLRRLPSSVFLAHVDHALKPEQGARGCRCNAVLSGPGLGDDTGLAHSLGEQCLTQHVVDLVRAGVVQVLALEQDPRAPPACAPNRGASVSGLGRPVYVRFR